MSNSLDEFGTAEDRVVFLKHLRNRRQLTIEDIARKTLYSSETVRSWFAGRRPCHDRAVRYLLAGLKMTPATYWAIVKKG